MNERNLNEGQWEDRKQWSLGVEQRFETDIHTYIYCLHVLSFIYLRMFKRLGLYSVGRLEVTVTLFKDIHEKTPKVLTVNTKDLTKQSLKQDFIIS